MPDHGRAAAPVFEFATFTVHDADEAALLAKRPAMIEALQRAVPGALAAWLVKQDDGSRLDVILWRSRHEVEEAAQTIDEIPEARAWFRHIAESRGIRHAAVTDERLFSLRRN
jgi:hypothetical protein